MRVVRNTCGSSSGDDDGGGGDIVVLAVGCVCCMCGVVCAHVHVSRVPDQNGISQACYIVEIYHSGPDPCMCVYNRSNVGSVTYYNAGVLHFQAKHSHKSS